jgi:hypothetical protein
MSFFATCASMWLSTAASIGPFRCIMSFRTNGASVAYFPSTVRSDMLSPMIHDAFGSCSLTCTSAIGSVRKK